MEKHIKINEIIKQVYISIKYELNNKNNVIIIISPLCMHMLNYVS